MWYSTVVESPQAISAVEVNSLQEPDSLLEQTAKAVLPKEIPASPGPGSEYWLP